MADELGPAVTALQRKLEEQLQAVADTKRTINMLMKMSGQEPMYPDGDAERSGAVRADQFYGKGLTTSAAEYLAMRQQACQADEIFRGLKAGGFDFDLQGWQGDDRDMIRNIAMSLSKNTGSTGKFHRLKNGSFGLRAWYDPAFLKKAKEAEGVETAGRKKKKKSAKTKTVAKTPGKETKAQKEPKAGKRATKKPELVNPPKDSAKEKGRAAADQTAQKEAAS
jgi:hypothetical protein